MENRGGKRAGSGRKKGNPTKVIAFRIPEQDYDKLIKLDGFVDVFKDWYKRFL